MTLLAWQYRSSVPGISWPAIPDQQASALLALQFQLERTQWLSPERLLELQFRQLDGLTRHAWETVPYYRERWAGLYDPAQPLTPKRFAKFPLLRRADLQSGFEELKSVQVPPQHGPLSEVRTSGSTGVPVRALKTALNELWWRAITLRDHRWHGRDLSGTLAAIRHKADAAEGGGWGPATDQALITGPAATLPISRDVGSQLDWLVGRRPDYLMTYPSNVAELARRSLERGVRLPTLREVRTFGEMLDPEVRMLCREAWGVPVIDAYSANEIGNIALQCPGHERYHVHAECILLEVLDDAGKPCMPGVDGRVVITDLHNFALPLVRYEIGDYAVAGTSCPCGRGLPVLERINGRVRNILVLPGGERYWPSFGQRGFTDVAPILQHKFVQRDFSTIEAQLVVGRPLSVEEEARIERQIVSKLPGSFRLKFVYCTEIARSAGGKFEDFESDVAGTA